MESENFSPIQVFPFSWTLDFLLMIWYSILINRINPELNISYFDQKQFEKNGTINKYFGVYIYRKLLVWVGWERINKKDNSIRNDLTKLKIREYYTRISELGHAIIAIIVFIMGFSLSSSLAEAKWFIISNVLLNIYSILVQRFNRPRYGSLIGRKNFYNSIVK